MVNLVADATPGYGNTTIGTNTSGLATANRWRYAGGWWDAGELMYHFGARYYDPTIARFLQLDPSGKSVAYLYAGDDPINNTDPTGLGVPPGAGCWVAPGVPCPPEPSLFSDIDVLSALLSCATAALAASETGPGAAAACIAAGSYDLINAPPGAEDWFG